MENSKMDNKLFSKAWNIFRAVLWKWSSIFNKYPSGTETINDIDANIINLFKVCRDKPYELAKAIELTPYSKDEYFYCRKIMHVKR